MRAETQVIDLVGLAIKLGLIVAFVFLASRVAASLIGRVERAIRSDGRGPAGEREARARTIGSVLRGGSWLLILVIAALMGVREVGLDISPALAAAGGFGVAAGLGAQTLVRIPVSAEEDPDRAIATLEAVLAGLREDPRVKPHLLEEPRVLGVEDIGAGQYTLLIRLATHPAQRFEVSRILRLRALERLRAAGIRTGQASPAGPAGAPPTSG